MRERLFKLLNELVNIETWRLVAAGFGLSGMSVFYFGYFVSIDYGAPRFYWDMLGKFNVILLAFPLLAVIGIFLAKRDFSIVVFLKILAGAVIGSISGLVLAPLLVFTIFVSKYIVPALIGFSIGASFVILPTKLPLSSKWTILFGVLGIAAIFWLLFGPALIRGESAILYIAGAGCAFGASLMGSLAVKL